jgi:hypothetical protein
MFSHKLSMNVLMIALALGAVVCFGAFVLYGAWIDGRRQKVREKGLHPVTTEQGDVEAAEGKAREQRDGR